MHACMHAFHLHALRLYVTRQSVSQLVHFTQAAILAALNRQLFTSL